MIKQQYDSPVIYWCNCPTSLKVYPIYVVAETLHSVWVKPDRAVNRNGREYGPRRYLKRSLATFHSFHEAQDELVQRLKSRLDRNRATCKLAEDALERALALVSPADG